MAMMVKTIVNLKAEVFGKRRPFSAATHAVNDGMDDMNKELNCSILEDGKIGVIDQNDLFAEYKDEFLDEITNRENETDWSSVYSEILS